MDSRLKRDRARLTGSHLDLCLQRFGRVAETPTGGGEDVADLSAAFVVEVESATADQDSRTTQLHHVGSCRPALPFQFAEPQELEGVVQRTVPSPRHIPCGNGIRRPTREDGGGVVEPGTPKHEAGGLDALTLPLVGLTF
jgi:hypothetical protein